MTPPGKPLTPVLDRLVTQSTESPCLIKGLPMPCWRWKGLVNKGGYGYMSIKRGTRWQTSSTHRIAYTTLVGEIPDGLELDHLCRNRRCWNPWHLEPVTKTVNVRRGRSRYTSGEWLRAKTHCPHGHAYDERNTRVSRSGRRHCRACERLRARRNRASAR